MPTTAELKAAMALIKAATETELIESNISSELMDSTVTSLGAVSKAKKAETVKKKQLASESTIKAWNPYIQQIVGRLFRDVTHQDFIKELTNLDISSRPAGSMPDMTIWATFKDATVTHGVSLPKKMTNGDANGNGNGNGERAAKKPAMVAITYFQHADGKVVDSSDGAATRAIAYLIGMDINEDKYKNTPSPAKLRDYIIPAFNGSWADGAVLPPGNSGIDARVALLEGCQLRQGKSAIEDAKLFFLKHGAVTQDMAGKYQHS